MTVAELLAELIRFDTRNPGGDEAALATLLYGRLRALDADEVDLARVGNHAYVTARFGTPRLLVNAHIDTVPDNPGWSRPPHEPHVGDGKLYGLGSCDTKGAIAAILTAIEEVRPKNTLVLFSGDEEHGGSCMRAFLQSGHAKGIERAIVCEPTRTYVGTRHRGVMAFSAELSGEGGHSSLVDKMCNPIAELARLAVQLDDWGRRMLTVGPPGFPGMCLNVADLRGGVAFNVVAKRAELLWSLRPPPGASLESVHNEMAELVAKSIAPKGINWRATLQNPAFATRDLASFAPLLGERVKSPVDLGFWTEAAMLSEAGIDAVVFGPGDISLAHAPNEYVTEKDLEIARQVFVEMFRGSV